MSVAPIVKSVTVKAAPEKTFDLFTRKTGTWWKAGQTLGKHPHQDIVIEPKTGGRWYERDAEGNEVQWGRVLAFEPSHRLLLAWQIDKTFKYDPDLVTELEITFTPAAGGGTTVRLEHRNRERFGAGTEKLIGIIKAGWTSHIATFGGFADAAP
jgi:uncharacterized protein YndB with AHSA1/START domain